MKDLSGRIALVMGAGTAGEEIGNGRATAILMARHGATVICADRDAFSAARTAEMIAAEGGVAEPVAVDATKEVEVASLVSEIIGRHGRIDVLDNNIGVLEVGSVTELSEADWDRLLAVNLKSAIFSMKHVIPHMISQGGGAVVNISSIASIRWAGVPYTLYYTTKAALNHLSRTTAIEIAKSGVRVNTVLPGMIKTPLVSATSGITSAHGVPDMETLWAERDRQVPMGHMGEPWDVAEAVLFLSSDRAKFITGTDLVVDGGMSVQMN
ncbi:SDR family NAD(P)-dependent oxidoreductase [Rhodococcus rhodochrous]|uniref:SDR family NAD(P)-dependent oxidoreductase n=1 Tax=Rhodococcus rhodochrous TaxID=1829 RepID=UPI0009BD4AFB|nr:SDR family oxidoreductase [Rhodococcus rhodochrous]